MDGMKRPEATVLPDSALIPSNCQISPAPNQFTHEVTRSQPFYASRGTPSGPPTGQFDAGAKVAALVIRRASRRTIRAHTGQQFWRRLTIVPQPRRHVGDGRCRRREFA